MSGLEVWLLLVIVPNIGVASCIIAVILSLVLLFSIVCLWSTDLDDEDTPVVYVKSVFTKCIYIMPIFLLLSCLAPSREEMVGIIVIPYVVNNPNFNKLPGNIAEYINNIIKNKDK